MKNLSNSILAIVFIFILSCSNESLNSTNEISEYGADPEDLDANGYI
ncbi:hypothetical protein [uncultured Aquimarina sp.]|nr:hypothetical protein [uncultured Aquimarina sp.]